MSLEPAPALRTIVLGNDAFVAARPAVPLQLIGACLRAGYDFVAPVAWGEEMLAARVVERARAPVAAPIIPVHCPFVAEALRAQVPPPGTCLTGVAPPVATARYLRAVFRGRELHITYCGRCPGAAGVDVDERVLPDVLLGRLAESGIVPAEQPRHLESQLPPELARYASVPGGMPEPRWLAETSGAEMREAAPATLPVLARMTSAEMLVVDLLAASGCVCARDRLTMATLEPPRARVPTPPAMAAMSAAIDLENGPRLWPDDWDRPVPLYDDVVREPAPRGAPPRETVAPLTVPGLADAAPAREPSDEPDDPWLLRRLTLVVEPWLTSPPTPLPRRARRAASPPAVRPSATEANAAPAPRVAPDTRQS